MPTLILFINTLQISASAIKELRQNCCIQAKCQSLIVKNFCPDTEFSENQRYETQC